MAAEQLNYAGIAERLRIATVNGTCVARRYGGFVRAEFERDRGYERLGHRPKLPGAVTTEAGAGNPLQEVAASEAWAALAASNR